MAKFLIIRFSSIGDIVLTTPVVRCLKKQVPDAEIHYLVKESFRSVLEHNPYIDKLHFLSDQLETIIPELQKEDYDFVIDLHHNLRSWQVKNRLKKKSFSFHKLNVEKYLLTRLKLNFLPKVHIVERYLKTVENFGVKNDGQGLEYFVAEQEQVGINEIPVSHHSGFIACVIGAGHGTKKLPVHKWKEFCQKLKQPVILLGGKEDREQGNAIASADPVNVFNGCGKFSINGSADLIRRAQVVVTNDTGFMHIAAAFKKPIVSLWGNTIPSFGMYPYYGENYLAKQTHIPFDIMETKKLWCRPCSKLGYQKCPLGNFKCMENIPVDEMINSVKSRQ